MDTTSLDTLYKVLFKTIRKTKNLTQKQLSEILGKKTITIQAYENGRLNISSDILYLLVKKTHLLKNQFIDIISSSIFLGELSKELGNDENKIKEIINSEVLIDLVEDLFYTDVFIDFMSVPICPITKDKVTNQEYTKKLTEFCQDQIYSHIVKLKRLNGLSETLDDKIALDISEKVISYLNFLLQENGILKK